MVNSNVTLRKNMFVNENNELIFAGVNTIDLKEKYGTPLYVYDIDMVKENLSTFKRAFERNNQPSQVAYASKAFSSLALYQILAKEDVSLDVVSGGELYLAMKAGFPVDKIHLHGNNKSYIELEEAINAGIGCIVVDNFRELELIDQITQEKRKNVSVLLRLTPGVKASTHDYISTGQEDSKFGFDLHSGQAFEALEVALSLTYVHVLGLHAHIGSQIFETDGFVEVTKVLMETAKEWENQTAFKLQVLNVGGGFGIEYTEDDNIQPYANFIDEICTTLQQESQKLNMKTPEVWIEPGRSIVGEAGITLYDVGSRKSVEGIRNYVSVDGGMADNIRPALYQAEYTAIVANKVNQNADETVSIAGKACESGDMLIFDIDLPRLEPSDTLALLATGAYGYSMASNYNRLTKPAVVFIEDGKDYLAIRRETHEDFLRLEQSIYMND